jgi:ubiquinone/menaquinone biosynthesis C-methylase UbiE
MQTQFANGQIVTDYFESAAAYWKNVYSGDRLLSAIYRDRYGTALEWVKQLGLDRSARILEIGCGAGLITIALAQNGYSVDAVDSTMAMIQLTRKDVAGQNLQERVWTYAADVHALPFETERFDLVIAIGVIPWLHSEDVALQEMRRVLKPGGHLLVTADNNARLTRILDPISSPISVPLRFAAKRILKLCGLWSPKPGLQPKRHYPYEVNRLVRECGFANLKSCTLGFGPFTLFGKNLLTDHAAVGLHRRLQMLALRSDLLPLRWTGSHYVVLATKT